MDSLPLSPNPSRKARTAAAVDNMRVILRHHNVAFEEAVNAPFSALRHVRVETEMAMRGFVPILDSSFIVIYVREADVPQGIRKDIRHAACCGCRGCARRMLRAFDK